jgi:hypothetical protein
LPEVPVFQSRGEFFARKDEEHDMSKEIQTSETQATESNAVQGKQAQSGCCGGAAPQGADACCALDADIKSSGGSGCGCASQAASGARKKVGCC